MPTDDTEDVNDTPEMRRLLASLSNLPPEKLRRLWKLVEDAINAPRPAEDEEAPK